MNTTIAVYQIQVKLMKVLYPFSGQCLHVQRHKGHQSTTQG